MTANREVVVMCWEAPTVSDRRAHAIAAFMGADVAYARVSRPTQTEPITRSKCLIVHAETLSRAAATMPDNALGLAQLTSVAEHVFIFGFDSSSRQRDVLRTLSRGALASVCTVTDGTAFTVAGGDRQWCAQFSGLTFGAARTSHDHGFVGDPAESHTMITLAGSPFFVRVNNGGSDMFFAGCRELAELGESVGRQSHLLMWFSRLAPLMMFLRGALGDRLWHNDAPLACLIIDDPPLRKRYGYLSYGRLLGSMRRQPFSASIAFIPWNYRRTDKKVAELFTSTQTPLGLCVHGCDHTRAEFATSDTESLTRKAGLALERMRMHAQLSGVPFTEIMVFPQGLFSPQAMDALKSAGYLAAVNSHVCPSTSSSRVLLRDLLEVATRRFGNLPLFGRRYPDDIAGFAFDLFLGKPVLAVEHHSFFRDGHAALERFVTQLKALDSRLAWAGLGTVCSQASLARVTSDSEIHVRFHTARFALVNDSSRRRSYVLQQSVEGTLPTVFVNGRPCDCHPENGLITFRVSLDPGCHADVHVTSPAASHVLEPWRATLSHRAHVRLRRHLCDIRDNYVATNRILRGLVSGIRAVRPTTTAPVW